LPNFCLSPKPGQAGRLEHRVRLRLRWRLDQGAAAGGGGRALHPFNRGRDQGHAAGGVRREGGYGVPGRKNIESANGVTEWLGWRGGGGVHRKPRCTNNYQECTEPSRSV